MCVYIYPLYIYNIDIYGGEKARVRYRYISFEECMHFLLNLPLWVFFFLTFSWSVTYTQKKCITQNCTIWCIFTKWTHLINHATKKRLWACPYPTKSCFPPPHATAMKHPVLSVGIPSLYLFIYFAGACAAVDVGSQFSEQGLTPGRSSEGAKSWPLDRQGKPRMLVLEVNLIYVPVSLMPLWHKRLFQMLVCNLTIALTEVTEHLIFWQAVVGKPNPIKVTS